MNVHLCFLLQDLLKHTPEDHPDHQYLLDAQRDIKRLAERINKGRRSAEEAEREARVIQEIEAHIEGVEHVRWSLESLLKYNRMISTVFSGVTVFYDMINSSLFASMLDSQPPEEVPQTGNGHGGGKK